jgi:hypothetical protein
MLFASFARVAEEGNLIALEHAVWGLLEVFFIDASRSGGFIAEVCCMHHKVVLLGLLTRLQMHKLLHN